MALFLQYSTSFAWSSWVVRKLCHSPFSHVDVIVPGEGLLGASGPDKKGPFVKDGIIRRGDPGGVQIRPFEAWPYKVKKTVELDIPAELSDKIINCWKTQVGKPFDHNALYAFLGDKPAARDWRNTDRWFCSEGVMWAMELGGLFPYELVVTKDRISPADSLIYVNPFMRPMNIKEFTLSAWR